MELTSQFEKERKNIQEEKDIKEGEVPIESKKSKNNKKEKEKEDDTKQYKDKQKKFKASITFPYSSKLGEILLTEYNQKSYLMLKNGVPIAPDHVNYSKKFRDVFQKLGYDFQEVFNPTDKGKESVWGIRNIKVHKIWDEDEDIIQELEVEITDKSLDDAEHKINILAKKIYEETKIEGIKIGHDKIEACKQVN